MTENRYADRRHVLDVVRLVAQEYVAWFNSEDEDGCWEHYPHWGQAEARIRELIREEDRAWAQENAEAVRIATEAFRNARERAPVRVRFDGVATQNTGEDTVPWTPPS